MASLQLRIPLLLALFLVACIWNVAELPSHFMSGNLRTDSNESGVVTKRFLGIEDVVTFPAINQPASVEIEVMELISQRNAVDIAFGPSKPETDVQVKPLSMPLYLQKDAADIAVVKSEVLVSGTITSMDKQANPETITQVNLGVMEFVPQKDAADIAVVKNEALVSGMMTSMDKQANPEMITQVNSGAMEFVSEKNAANIAVVKSEAQVSGTLDMLGTQTSNVDIPLPSKPETITKSLNEYESMPTLNPTGQVKPETMALGAQNDEVITPGLRTAGRDYITVLQTVDTSNPELVASNTIPMVGQKDEVPAARNYP